MKVYLLYFNSKYSTKMIDEDIDIYNTSKIFDDTRYFLYGWCNKKKIIKDFEFLRNMDLFIKLKVDMSESEFKDFSYKYDSLEIRYEPLSSKYSKNEIVIPLSDLEYEIIIDEGELLLYDLANIAETNKLLALLINSMNKKYVKKFKNIQLIDALKISQKGSPIYDSDIEVPFGDIYLDKLEAFLKHFSNTLK